MTDLSQSLFNFASTALVAVMAGGISYAAGKGMKKQEWHLALRREKIALRQRLYTEFLAETERLTLLSIDKKINDIAEFNSAVGKWAEIELVASAEVRESVKKLLDGIFGSHLKDAKSDGILYPLKAAFIECARIEITALEA